MALNVTYTNSGAACIGAGLTCFAHGLPTTPDFAIFAPITDGTANVCLPVKLTRGAAHVAINGALANGTGADALFQVFHSIIR